MIARVFFAVCLLSGALLVGAALGRAFTAADLPPDAASGYAIWLNNSCAGCHTLYGQGGAYAPDLTHIYTQRGPDYLREFLANPAAFHPDQRAMPRFGLSQNETDQLLAFLAWINTQPAATNWPPRPIFVSGGGTAQSAPVADNGDPTANSPVERGRALFSRAPAICSTCHSLEPDVIIVGPSLYGIADRASERVPGVSPEEYLRVSVLDPSAFVVPGFNDVMQKNFADTLTSENVSDLIAFLMTLEANDANP
ncbi:MAG: cytochrome c [Chloroflexi bacterium]|nr:cytochrome c [Chloroflexota bacterium]